MIKGDRKEGRKKRGREKKKGGEGRSGKERSEKVREGEVRSHTPEQQLEVSLQSRTFTISHARAATIQRLNNGTTWQGGILKESLPE